MGTVRRSILLAVVAAALLPGTASAAAGGARTPLEAVHNYVAGVARLNAAEICRSFDPRLRLLVRRELGELPNVDSCAAAVASVLPFNRGHLWAGVRIERVNAVSLDRQSEIATVAVTLSRPARCAARGRSRSRCRARRASARDTIYALLSGGAWSIVKPGGLLRAAEVGGPLPRDPFYYAPPATPATVNRIAALAPAGFACPAALGAADPADDVRDEYRPAAVPAPWLDLRRIGVAPLGDDSTCFSIELGAPPQSDSAYVLFLGAASRPEPIDAVELEVDGVGSPHLLRLGQSVPLQVDGAGNLPSVGESGSLLQIALPGLRWPAHGAGWVFTVETSSLQSREPLLAAPLQASDRAPDHGCLEFPSGHIDLAEMCGSGPSG